MVEDIVVNKEGQYITMKIDRQIFGVSVYMVRDVMASPEINSIPLASKEVAGALNLRGRIVTAIDMRVVLGHGPRDPKKKNMSIVIEHKDELYSLLVDSVGEVLKLKKSSIEPTPENLDNRWREISGGVYKMEDKLIVILDINKLFEVMSYNESNTEIF